MPLVRPYSSVHLPMRIPTGVFINSDGGVAATMVPPLDAGASDAEVGIGESIMIGVGAT